MRRLTFVTALNSVSSYGLHAIQIVRGLLARGIQPSIRVARRLELFGVKLPDDIKDCITRTLSDDPWELVLHPHGFRPTPGKKTVYYVAHESTKLPAASVAMFNQCQLVIVPSRWCETVLSANGVTVPIRVVPLGIDPAVFHYQRRQSGPFVFGAGGRMAHGFTRKGLNEAAFVFARAFPDRDDVRLQIKCFPDCPIQPPDDERVWICRDFLPAERLADWYGSLDVFLSCAKGEGFGLMQLEASACGRPVLGTAFGGVTEFFHRDNGIVVEHRLRASDFGWDGSWGEPQEADLIARMRWAVEHRETVAELGLKAAASAMALTWDNSINRLLDVLNEFGVFEDNDKGVF